MTAHSVCVVTEMTKYIWESQGYQTLDELCQLDYFTSMGNSCYTSVGTLPPYNGFEAIKEWPDLRKATQQKLSHFGFKRFSFVGHGDFAVVLKTVDRQVARISVDEQEFKRPKHPSILQPRQAFLIKDETNPESPTLRLELLTQIKDNTQTASDRISTTGVTQAHVEELKEVLRASRLSPLDLCIKNVALMSDGTPLVIDGGSVNIDPNHSMVLDEKILSRWFSKDPSGATTWKQFSLYPEIAKGEITGGIIPSDIVMLQNKLGENNIFTQAVLADGLYRHELGQLITNTGIHFDKAQTNHKPISITESFRLARSAFDLRRGPSDDAPSCPISELVSNIQTLYRRAAEEITSIRSDLESPGPHLASRPSASTSGPWNGPT